MSSLVDEINNQVKEGKKTIVRSMGEISDGVEGLDASRVRLMVAGAAIAAAAVGVGVILYRRRRRTLAERLQRALPETLRDQLKRPLQRAVRAL